MTSKVAIPCRFFALGTCNRGTDCIYLHETDSVMPPPPAAHHSEGSGPRDQIPSDSRSQVQCSFFARGKCLKGDKCVFTHAEIAETAGAEARTIVVRSYSSLHLLCSHWYVTSPGLTYYDLQKPELNEDWTRSFGGGMITFKDGVAVSKVCMPTDFSAVRLDNLPQHSDLAAVSRFLTRIGVADKLASTRIVPSTGPHSIYCSAEVKVEDPSFARRLCTKVAAAADSQVKAAAIAAPAQVSTGGRRIDCRKIACSWHRPVKIVWLNFGNRDIASKVQARFASGVYNILDHQVEASSPSGQDNRGNPLGRTVTLSAVPGRADQADVARAIPDHWKPRKINVGEPTYEVDADTARASVKSMLMDIGPLAWWEDTTGPDSKREKALARYVEGADAQRAASILNNAPLPFAKKARLAVQAFTTAKFRVLTRVYKALEPRIDAQRPAWKDARLWFTSYASVNGYNVLKIEGEKRQDFADAAGALERILAGEVATADGVALWSPSLRSNTETYGKVKAIECDTGIIILRNKRKCQMRLYGPADRCEQARTRLATVVKEDSASTFSLKVTAKQLQ